MMSSAVRSKCTKSKQPWLHQESPFILTYFDMFDNDTLPETNGSPLKNRPGEMNDLPTLDFQGCLPLVSGMVMLND